MLLLCHLNPQNSNCFNICDGIQVMLTNPTNGKTLKYLHVQRGLQSILHVNLTSRLLKKNV